MKNMANIVFLDRKSLGSDLDLGRFQELGNITEYDFSTSDEIPERVKDADIIITNKCQMNENTLGEAKKVKAVCVTATGVNNLDIPYLEGAGIHWHNVAGYSTDSVAQHTLALVLYLYEHLPYYDEYVKSGAYAGDTLFTHFERPFCELTGKTWGIVGLGAIGRRTAQIASSFGCRVVYYSTSGVERKEDYPSVSWDELLETSDIITIHAPLNEKTKDLFGREAFKKMKKSALLVNVGRGPILVEKDLAEAIDTGEIAAAGLDVLEKEPMVKDSPFLSMKHKERILITPHIAWASLEARKRLMDIIYQQVKEELELH